MKEIKAQKKYAAVFQELSAHYNCPAWLFKADVVWCRLLYGAQIHYYFSFAMYRMNHRERMTFVNGRRMEALEALFNTNPDKDAIINNKVGFNKLFAKHIHRDWMYAPDHTPDEIKAFLERNSDIMVKPPDTNMGIGIFKISCAEALADFDAFIHKVVDGKMLMEAFIHQHPAMSEVNPTSVNTVRIATVRDQAGEVHLIGASLRGGGANQVVDNFKANGVQYPIDPQTGIIIGGGVMHNGTRNVYFHPSTNKQMIGFRIPNWDQIVATVKEAGKLPENIRYIGWDMAVTEDGCDIVEANIHQGSNGMQQDGVGKYRIILQYK